MKELALRLALPSPRLGFSTLSCVALGSHGTSLGVSFLIRKREGIVPTAITLFGENEM